MAIKIKKKSEKATVYNVSLIIYTTLQTDSLKQICTC